MEINKVSKVGIIIEVMAISIIFLLVLFNKPIPSLLAWVFNIGLLIALAGIVTVLSKSKMNKTRL